MEVITGEQELKHELFLRAEELERLVAIYKLKLCGHERNSLNYCTDPLMEEKRGKFYDIYMMKREVKLREEWQAKGAKIEAEMKAMMESLDSNYSWMMSKGKVTEANNEHSKETNSRKFYPSSTVAQNSTTGTLSPAIRSTNLASLKQENTKPLKGTDKGTPLQRNIMARTKSSGDRIGLVKGIRTSRSQSLRKNPTGGLGEPKDFKPPNSTVRLRISVDSLEEDQMEEASENLKEVGGQFEPIRANDIQNLRFSKDSMHSSHNMDQFREGNAIRARKKWGSVERPFPAVDASARSTVEATKGFKRFLKLGVK